MTYPNAIDRITVEQAVRLVNSASASSSTKAASVCGGVGRGAEKGMDGVPSHLWAGKGKNVRHYLGPSPKFWAYQQAMT